MITLNTRCCLQLYPKSVFIQVIMFYIFTYCLGELCTGILFEIHRFFKFSFTQICPKNNERNKKIFTFIQSFGNYARTYISAIQTFVQIYITPDISRLLVYCQKCHTFIFSLFYIHILLPSQYRLVMNDFIELLTIKYF